jgi:zinc transport system substrate-binding protein
MRYKILTLIAIFVLGTTLIGCNNETTTTQKDDNNKLKVYTTLYPLADFTKKIGGDQVDVESIIPPGADAHTFEPTSKQMIDIAEADAFIYNGLGMETYAEKIAEALENEDTIMVEAAHGIEVVQHTHDHHTHEAEHHESDEHEHEAEHHEADEHAHEEEHHESDEHAHEEENHESDEHAHEEEHHESDEHAHEDKANEHEHHHRDVDPHVWLDPIRAIILAQNIKDALIELKPEAKEEFENNFITLKAELEKLDEEFHQLVDAKKNPEMIVSHAAYGYWEESYGIHQIAVAGISPTDEPSQKDLANIIKLAKEKQIQYIIFEQNVTPKVAEVIRKEINAEPLRLHNLSVLTEEDIQNGEDYFSLMRKNIETLDKVLH